MSLQCRKCGGELVKGKYFGGGVCGKNGECLKGKIDDCNVSAANDTRIKVLYAGEKYHIDIRDEYNGLRVFRGDIPELIKELKLHLPDKAKRSSKKKK